MATDGPYSRYGWRTRHRLIVVLPLEALLDQRLTRADLALLCALSSWRDQHSGLAKPTRRNLALRCGRMSERTISRGIARLERFGWAMRIGKTGGRNSPNLITVGTPDELINPDSADKVSDGKG